MHPERTSWRVIGASVQGASHRRQGLACQDSHRFSEANGVLVAAVADGAGSASCSDIGSALAAQAAVNESCQRLRASVPDNAADWRNFLHNVFRAAHGDLLDQAQALDLAPLDLATTLLVAVVTPNWLAAGQVGDGAVIARHPDGSFQVVTRPDRQEYVNETTFLTSEAFSDHVQCVVQRGQTTGLAMLSDGLQRLALQLPQWQAHVAFFEPLLRLLAAAPTRDQAEEQLRHFLLSPRITQRADDDLTLLLAVRDDAACQD